MLDLLTHGRLEFGIGRGVDEQEFLRHNMPYPEARPRFEEGLELILKAWQQPEFEFDGKFLGQLHKKCSLIVLLQDGSRLSSWWAAGRQSLW
jgi:alkanesulfonate monooxygenase SsuD/methylene tetrahydromethanopterin reductase-like flavin-dependent oxidoreductase (luciferase family)